ncbi:MAG: flippase [Chloroflexia bacterium]
MPENEGAARRVALNTLNPFVAQVFTKIMTLGYLIVQYRVLGGQATGVLGTYILAALILLYLDTISEWGLGTLLTRDMARARGSDEGQHSAVTRLFAQTLALRLLLSVAMFVPAGLIIFIYTNLPNTMSNWGEGGTWALIILTLSLVPQAFGRTVTSVLFAYERMTLPALIGVGTSALNVALGLGALLLGFGVIGLALSALVAQVVTTAVFWWILQRNLPEVASGLSLGAMRLERKVALGLLAAGWPLLLNSLLVNLFFKVDQFIMEPILGSLSIERYNAPYSYLNFVLLITPAVTLALFPRMSRHAQDDKPRLAREYSFAIKALVSISGLIIVGTVWFAPLLVTIVTSGKEGFLPDSAIALQILIFFLPFSFVNGVTQYVLIALDKQKLITRAFAITLVFNVAANLALIPLLGINGAAFVTVLSEIVLLVPFVWWIGKELGPVGGGVEIGVGWKPLVAGLAAGAAMYGLWDVFANWNSNIGSVGLYIGAGGLLAVVYVVVLALLRPFTPEETAALARVFKRHG